MDSRRSSVEVSSCRFGSCQCTSRCISQPCTPGAGVDETSRLADALTLFPANFEWQRKRCRTEASDCSAKRFRPSDCHASLDEHNSQSVLPQETSASSSVLQAYLQWSSPSPFNVDLGPSAPASLSFVRSTPHSIAFAQHRQGSHYQPLRGASHDGPTRTAAACDTQEGAANSAQVASWRNGRNPVAGMYAAVEIAAHAPQLQSSTNKSFPPHGLEHDSRHNMLSGHLWQATDQRQLQPRQAWDWDTKNLQTHQWRHDGSEQTLPLLPGQASQSQPNCCSLRLGAFHPEHRQRQEGPWGASTCGFGSTGGGYSCTAATLPHHASATTTWLAATAEGSCNVGFAATTAGNTGCHRLPLQLAATDRLLVLPPSRHDLSRNRLVVCGDPGIHPSAHAYAHATVQPPQLAAPGASHVSLAAATAAAATRAAARVPGPLAAADAAREAILLGSKALGVSLPATARLAIHIWDRIHAMVRVVVSVRWPAALQNTVGGGGGASLERLYAMAALWLAMKLQEPRTESPGVRALCVLGRTLPSCMVEAEMCVLRWCEWAPYAGFLP